MQALETMGEFISQKGERFVRLSLNRMSLADMESYIGMAGFQKSPETSPGKLSKCM